MTDAGLRGSTAAPLPHAFSVPQITMADFVQMAETQFHEAVDSTNTFVVMIDEVTPVSLR